jgi:hypothetical protein
MLSSGSGLFKQSWIPVSSIPEAVLCINNIDITEEDDEAIEFLEGIRFHLLD